MTIDRYPMQRTFLTGSALALSLLVIGCDQPNLAKTSRNSSATASRPSEPSDNLSPAKEAGTATLSAGPSANVNFVRTVAEKVEPAVVTVHVMSAIERQPMTVQDMLGGRTSGPEVRRGAGSGVIISADGYIVTNNHVVAGAQRVTVEVGGTGYDARVVGADVLSDIAVVKITPSDSAPLPVAELGDSDTVHVGDWAIAIGNPLDIGATVTLGIVSAIGARGPHLQGDAASTVLQTDAAINPGNSGGALVNSDGKVIGINEAILSPTGSFIGIGFAIPINAAHKIAQQLIADGRVMRPYLGISYVPVKSIPPQARAQAGISPSLTSGVVVAEVTQDTPAAVADLQPGDVIIKADGKVLGDQDTLNGIISHHKVGDTLNLDMERAGKSRTISVILRERPSSFGGQPATEQQ